MQKERKGYILWCRRSIFSLKRRVIWGIITKYSFRIGESTPVFFGRFRTAVGKRHRLCPLFFII